MDRRWKGSGKDQGKRYFGKGGKSWGSGVQLFKDVPEEDRLPRWCAENDRRGGRSCSVRILDAGQGAFCWQHDPEIDFGKLDKKARAILARYAKEAGA